MRQIVDMPLSMIWCDLMANYFSIFVRKSRTIHTPRIHRTSHWKFSQTRFSNLLRFPQMKKKLSFSPCKLTPSHHRGLKQHTRHFVFVLFSSSLYHYNSLSLARSPCTASLSYFIICFLHSVGCHYIFSLVLTIMLLCEKLAGLW